MDEKGKDEFFAHFGRMMSVYTAAVILSVTGDSAETREMATKAAQDAMDHIAADVAFLLGSDKSDNTEDLVEAFKKELDQL